MATLQEKINDATSSLRYIEMYFDLEKQSRLEYNKLVREYQLLKAKNIQLANELAKATGKDKYEGQ